MKESIKCLLASELQDLISTEEQIIKEIPKLIIASETQGLKNIFKKGLQRVKGQLQRNKEICKLLKISSRGSRCNGARGLIQEIEEARSFKKSPLRDAALIAKASRIVNYKISAYKIARALARELGQREAVALLQETIDEEVLLDKALTKLAVAGIVRLGILRLASSLEASARRPRTQSRGRALARR